MNYWDYSFEITFEGISRKERRKAQRDLIKGKYNRELRILAERETGIKIPNDARPKWNVG